MGGVLLLDRTAEGAGQRRCTGSHCGNAGRALGGSWGADGAIVLADGVALFRVAADGGPMQMLARPAAERGEVRFAWPQLLPNGGKVLLTILRDELAKADIAILDPATGTSRVIVRGGHAARYVSTGHLVYAHAGRLQVLRLDPMALEARGDPVTVDSVELAQTVGAFTADFDVLERARCVSAPPAPADLRTMVWVDRAGREESLAAPPNSYVYPRISPDGTRIALDIAGANRGIWVWSLKRQVLTRIADGPTEDLMPAWSADGQRIFFASDVNGLFGVYARAADGSGQAELIVDGPENYMPFSAPDRDRLLLLVQGNKPGLPDIVGVRLSEPRQLDDVMRSRYQEANPHVSTDGRWLACSRTSPAGSRCYIPLVSKY